MNLLTIDANVIMDIAGAIVILLFVIIAAFRGFLRILISLLGTIASVIAAILLRPIFFKMYDSFGLTAGIGDGISKGLESLSGTIADKISGMKMPGFLAEVLGNTDIASQSAESAVTQNQIIAEKCSVFCVNVLSVLTGFILSMIIVFIIIQLSKLFTKLPVIGPVDRILGALLGLVMGIVFVYFITSCIYMLSSAGLGIDLAKALDNTVLLKFIYEKSPLTLLLIKKSF